MDKVAMGNIEDAPQTCSPRQHQECTNNGSTTYFEQMMSQIVDEVYMSFTPPTADDDIDLNVHVPGVGLRPITFNVGE